MPVGIGVFEYIEWTAKCIKRSEKIIPFFDGVVKSDTDSIGEIPCSIHHT
jgi:hypothetical protein